MEMEQENYTCQYCGSNTYEDVVRMCLWEGERLVVIEDIPARVCENCMEQFYDSVTRFRIDTFREERFPLEEARRVIEVPIFSLEDVKIPEPEKDAPERPEDVEIKTKDLKIKPVNYRDLDSSDIAI